MGVRVRVRVRVSKSHDDDDEWALRILYPFSIVASALILHRQRPCDDDREENKEKYVVFIINASVNSQMNCNSSVNSSHPCYRKRVRVRVSEGGGVSL